MAPVVVWGRSYTAAKSYRERTHRTREPHATLADYAPFMERMGITRLANITGLDTIGIPVFTAIRPTARSLSTSQGKGLDPCAAKVSALMESIECWHAEHIEAGLRWDTPAALARHASVIDVERLPLHEGQTVRMDLPLLWIEGWDIIQQRATWVPFELVTMNFVQPEGWQPTFFPSSNGLASGNHVLEAIVHGACEVIERDAEVLWRTSDRFELLELSTMPDLACRDAVERIQRAGLGVAVWDMTADNRVPSCGAVILEPPGSFRSLGAYYGFGSHLAPEVAALRALTEAAQARVTYIAGSRDDLYHEDYAAATDPELVAAIWNEIQTPQDIKSFDSISSLATVTFEDDISVLLESLSRTGIDSVVAVDLSKPDIGIPVVRVLIPGLEGPDDPKCQRGARAGADAEASP